MFFFLVLPQEAKPAGVRASAATLDRGGPFGVSVDSPPALLNLYFLQAKSCVLFLVLPQEAKPAGVRASVYAIAR